MSDAKAGDRVGAISHTEGDTVYIFGYGVYTGDEVPVGAGGFMGRVLCRAKKPNPKIVLDNGKVVWGCECWWGPEDDVKRSLEGQAVVEVDIEARRVSSYGEEVEIAQDREYVEVTQAIEGEYPEIDDIREAIKDTLCHSVGTPHDEVVPEITSGLLSAFAFLYMQGTILQLNALSVQLDAEDNSAEATLGVVLASGKELSLSVVVKAAAPEGG